MDNQKTLNLAKDKLVEGKVEEVLFILKNLCQDSEIEDDLKTQIENEILILSSKNNTIMEHERIGIIKFEDLIIQKTKLNKSIIEVINFFSGKTLEINNSDIKDKGFQIRNTIQLTINQPFDTFSTQDRENILSAIATLLNMTKTEIVISKIEKGSVKLSIELDKIASEKLKEQVNAGALRFLKVENAEIISTKVVKLRQRKSRKIFLSFNKRDLKFAKSIRNMFEERGIEVYLNLSQLEAGRDWINTIMEELRNSNEFVILISKNNVLDSFLDVQLGWALAMEKNIVLILLDVNEDELPEQLKGIRKINFTDNKENLEELLLRLSDEK